MPMGAPTLGGLLACAAFACAALAGAGCQFNGSEAAVAVIEPPYGTGRFNCKPAVTAPFATLEIGPSGTDLDGDAVPFAPLADGESVHVVFGGQGSQMVVFRFRVTG